MEIFQNKKHPRYYQILIRYLGWSVDFYSNRIYKTSKVNKINK